MCRSGQDDKLPRGYERGTIAYAFWLSHYLLLTISLHAVELAYHLFTGALAAVLAGLFNTVAAPALAVLRTGDRHQWREPSLSSQLATLTVYLLVGIGLGLLFWLSWGLTAIVGVPWWLRGSVFALLFWLVCCVPLLAMQLLSLRLSWKTTAAFAVDWLVIFASVGLACAWTWAKVV
jgi:hypothetical protein